MAAMSERVVFWYGCNVLRHGDIIHSAMAVLDAVGIASVPAGGPAFCCGTMMDGNLDGAAGLAARTFGKFNRSGRDKAVTWCPSCHRHAGSFMTAFGTANFEVAHIIETLHARRQLLAALLSQRIERKVLLHAHTGFHEVDVNMMVVDLLRLIPGLDVVVPDYAAPGHMCSALVPVPAALKDVVRRNVELVAEHGAGALVTVFHSCQRLLCGLATTDGVEVVNYINLLAQSLGMATAPDEYAQWKNAGSDAAIVEQIGAERIAKVGMKFFATQVMPELRKLPER